MSAASAAALSATILPSRAMICACMVPVGVGVVPALGVGVGDVDGDGVGPLVVPETGRFGIGVPLLINAETAALNDVPCCTAVWSPTITSCSCGNAVPPLAAAVTYSGRTYRNESLLNGRMITLPSVTVDPCWLSRVISELIVGLVLMLLSNCRGPRTLSALLRRTATSWGSFVPV